MKILDEYYGKKIRPAIENALDEGTRLLIEKLSFASPISSNPGVHFRDEWDAKTQYKGARYVGNKKSVPRSKSNSSQKGGIPLSSLLEYSPTKGRPFIERTFESNKQAIYALIARKMEEKT